MTKDTADRHHTADRAAFDHPSRDTVADLADVTADALEEAAARLRSRSAYLRDRERDGDTYALLIRCTANEARYACYDLASRSGDLFEILSPEEEG